jgi:hypothetical protein
VIEESKMLKAFYGCKLFNCTLQPAQVEVEVRERRADEDILTYLNHVAEECGMEHRRLSPFCPADKLDIGLPITQNGIGFDGPPLTEEDKKRLAEQ